MPRGEASRDNPSEQPPLMGTESVDLRIAKAATESQIRELERRDLVLREKEVNFIADSYAAALENNVEEFLRAVEERDGVSRELERISQELRSARRTDELLERLRASKRGDFENSQNRAAA